MSSEEVDFSEVFSLFSEAQEAWDDLSADEQELVISTVSGVVDDSGGISPGTDEETEFQRTGSRWLKISTALGLAAIPLKVTAPPVALVVGAIAAAMGLLAVVAGKMTPERVDRIADTFNSVAPRAYAWLCDHPYALVGVAFFGGSPSAAVSVAMDLKAGERFYLLGRCGYDDDDGRGSIYVPGQSMISETPKTVSELNAMFTEPDSDTPAGSGSSAGVLLAGSVVLGALAFLWGR